MSKPAIDPLTAPLMYDAVTSEYLHEICLVNPPPGVGNPIVVAQTWFDEDEHGPVVLTARMADAYARLFAAAPDLLSALRGILALYTADEGCRKTPEYVTAKAAIAKATRS